MKSFKDFFIILRMVNSVALSHHICGGFKWRQTAFVSREIFMCRECCKMFTSRGKLQRHFQVNLSLVYSEKKYDLCNIKPGGMGGCIGDKKSCFFHLELNYWLNWGFNKDNMSFELLKVVSQIFEISFFILSHFSQN